MSGRSFSHSRVPRLLVLRLRDVWRCAWREIDRALFFVARPPALCFVLVCDASPRVCVSVPIGACPSDRVGCLVSGSFVARVTAALSIASCAVCEPEESRRGLARLPPCTPCEFFDTVLSSSRTDNLPFANTCWHV